MKVFRDLNINVNESDIDTFISQLETKLINGWKREKELEKESLKRSGIVYYYFSCTSQNTRKAALLALTQKDKQNIYIPNIVPKEMGELSIDQYNDILLDFYTNFIAPIEINYKVKLTEDSQDISDWISAESAEKLKRFSGSANKSTGSSHPCDKDRWFAFIVSIILNKDELHVDQLERWLVEVEGWSRDIASELAVEYEQGISLLEYYRGIC